MGVHNRRQAWQIFPGKNRFFCGGRCIMARTFGIFYLTLALILVTTALFFSFECRILWQDATMGDYGGPLITVGAFCLAFFVVSTLLRCSFSDPGIIPRSTPDEVAWLDAEFEAIFQQATSTGSYRPPARNKEVVVNGRPLKLKYCYTCKIWRPPRASHCSTCDNCVDRFDHHCPWVGNCVGARNYRYFYLFVSSLSVYCVYIMAFSVLNLYLLSQKGSFLDAIKTSPMSIVEILVAFISVWSVLGLAGFHTMLICRETSTNEDIKGTFNTSRNPDLINPFSRSNVCSNFCGVICGPSIPSLLDLCAWIEVDSEGRPIGSAAASVGASANGSLACQTAGTALTGVRSTAPVSSALHNGGDGNASKGSLLNVTGDEKEQTNATGVPRVQYGATDTSPARYPRQPQPSFHPTPGPIVLENIGPASR